MGRIRINRSKNPSGTTETRNQERVFRRTQELKDLAEGEEDRAEGIEEGRDEEAGDQGIPCHVSNQLSVYIALVQRHLMQPVKRRTRPRL
ncbi:hypothetical protein NL676_001451 [Syzygium grande]|nr:hypothetical protein NL676_001451 [Syzygium grande]